MEKDCDLGFSWRERKNGEVELLRGGLVVTVLRREKALRFLAAVERGDGGAAQQLMARLTGNYKRGNEGLASAHKRNA